MEKKRVGIIIIMLAAAVLLIGTTARSIMLRRQAAAMIEDVVDEWKAGKLGSIGGDFREFPGEVLSKIRPESEKETEQLLELYGVSARSNESGDASKEQKEYSSELSDEEYGTLMKKLYPAYYETDQDEEEEEESPEPDEGSSIYEAIKDKIDVSYKLPLMIKYPLTIEMTVSAPSVEDAYLHADADGGNVNDLREAMIDYLQRNSAGTITETHKVSFFKSDGRLFAEPNETIANALTGGYADLICRLMEELAEEQRQ